LYVYITAVLFAVLSTMQSAPVTVFIVKCHSDLALLNKKA